MLCRLELEIWVCSSKDQTFSLFPFFPFSKTPHRFADFHLLGTVPLSIESWKILVRIGAISAANSFRNHGGMASGPEALFVFNSNNCFATPLMVIDRLSIDDILSYPISGIFDKSSWVKTLVENGDKHLKKSRKKESDFLRRSVQTF